MVASAAGPCYGGSDVCGWSGTNYVLCSVHAKSLSPAGEQIAARDRIIAAKDRELAKARAILELAMKRLSCKCGWDNIGKPGYCGPDFSEHDSCDLAIEARAALKEPPH